MKPIDRGNIPELPGIYKFYSSDNSLLYVGKAKNLKKRVRSYFLKNSKDSRIFKFINQIDRIEIIPVASEFEALLLEAKLINIYRPKYNVIWKDDKHYIYINITTEKFPKVLFARKTSETGNFFGPFPSSTTVRELLSFIRTIFPYCTQKETANRACFYHHLGLCNPCPAEIARSTGNKYKLMFTEYRHNIKNIKQILNGNFRKIEKILKRKMNSLAEDEKYEEATIFRDKLNKLDYLVNNYKTFDSYIENPRLLRNIRKEEEQALAITLLPFYPHIKNIHHLECYDISNISGKLATGALVTFKDGNPDKNLYRRFRIKKKDSPDDFFMLSEMMQRRLSHADWKLPDLFIIDGGKPQLIALKKILFNLNISIPFIGLAKHYEEIVIPNGNSYIKVRLPDNSPALNLVKRLRDEAHRFAHSYHTQLRLKYLLGRD